MAFDALVANPGRLRILTALAATRRQAFVELRRQTGLTDGNKPLTTLELTSRGRDALAAHAHALLRSLESPAAPAEEPASEDYVDDWVD
jgi:hypothetical protein